MGPLARVALALDAQICAQYEVCEAKKHEKCFGDRVLQKICVLVLPTPDPNATIHFLPLSLAGPGIHRLTPSSPLS